MRGAAWGGPRRAPQAPTAARRRSGGSSLDRRITAAVLKVFRKLDHDHDGLLSKKDLFHAINHKGLEMTKKDVKEMFKSTGHDGARRRRARPPPPAGCALTAPVGRQAMTTS